MIKIDYLRSCFCRNQIICATWCEYSMFQLTLAPDGYIQYDHYKANGIYATLFLCWFFTAVIQVLMSCFCLPH